MLGAFCGILRSLILRKLWSSWTLGMVWILISATMPGQAIAGEAISQLALSPEVKTIIEKNRPVSPGVSQEYLQSQAAQVLYDYASLEEEIGSEQLLWDGRCSPEAIGSDDWSIAPEQAASEVELLFEVLKYGYAGYEYFGGDEAFNAAKDEVLSQLAGFSDEIPMWKYVDILTASLSFVRDGHLSIGDRRVCEFHEFRASLSHRFYLSSEGEFENPDGARLLSVDGQAPSAYMKPSIDEDGDIVYLLGMVVPEASEDIVLELEYENGYAEMAWLIPFASMGLSGPAYALSEVNGIPVVTCRDFRDWRTDQRDAIARFVDDAEGLRDENVIILDLRSNRGGMYAYGKQWCRVLTDEEVGPSSYSRYLVTDTASALVANALQKSDEGRPGLAGLDDGLKVREEEKDPELPGWGYARFEQEVRAEDTPFVIVLTDSLVASAAEALIRRLRHVENVVFVGTNTRGAVLCGNTGKMRLPDSGQRLSVPTMICFDGEMCSVDGVGYYPDFWVHPDHAMDRALKFIENQLIQASTEPAEGQGSTKAPKGIELQ